MKTLAAATSPLMLAPTGASCDGARRVPVSGLRDGRHFERDDWVADEVPVALEFNGISHAVMLATPLDLEDFALGFALSEGILRDKAQLYGVEWDSAPVGITVHLEIAAEAFARLKDRRRSMTGRTGCGLCGTESLSQVARALPQLPRGLPLARDAIHRAMSGLCAQQSLHHATGAVHAAAWCSPQGEVQALREDVGRHNALDKLIGSLAREGMDAATGFIAVTSRASFEMVQKTAIAGVAMLAAVSAPTSLAIQTALEARMTLVGFARRHDLSVYTHPERLTFNLEEPCLAH